MKILFEQKISVHAHMRLNDGAVDCGALCLAALGGNDHVMINYLIW